MNSNLIDLVTRDEEFRMSRDLFYIDTMVTLFLANASNENFFVIKWGK
jgi:hypothetical protein